MRRKIYARFGYVPLGKLVILLLGLAFHTSTAAQNSAEKYELETVVKHFQDAIKEKDSSLFMSLFLHDSIPWIGISEPASWAYHQSSYPNVKQVETGSCKAFIRYVVNFDGPMEEKFFNVNIQADSVLATITFDYSLWKKEEPYGWGKESWMLLKTNNRWKITAVYYSGTSHKVQPVPKHFY